MLFLKLWDISDGLKSNGTQEISYENFDIQVID